VSASSEPGPALDPRPDTIVDPGGADATTDAPSVAPTRVRPPGFGPFASAPAATRRRYRGLIARCHSSRAAAIKAFCIECNGYSQPLAATCETRTCPLWAWNRDIFAAEPEATP
jgi:hypothetical protein